MDSVTSSLKGKVAVVTGGSGAIGHAIMNTLIQSGASATSLDISEASDKRNWMKCDLRDAASVSAVVQSVYQKKRRVDLVIHAAGISHDAVVWKMSVEDWDCVQAVNLRGALLLLRQAVR